MKAAIQVTNRKEAEAIKAGLQDPATRALVIIMGALSELPSDRARARTIQFVRDYYFGEQDQQEKASV